MINTVAMFVTLGLFLVGSVVLFTLLKEQPLKIMAWKDNRCVATVVEETTGLEAIKFAHKELRENDYDQIIIRNALTNEDYLVLTNRRKETDEKTT